MANFPISRHSVLQTYTIIYITLTQAHFITSIKYSDLNEFKGKSKVPLPVKGYPGYVDLKGQGQVFYWLFPRMDKVPIKNSKLSSENPLLIHIPGGPGVSITDIIFEASGPFTFKHVNKVGINRYSWSKLANVLYIDWPLGTGFSTVNKKWSYPRKPIMEAESLVEVIWNIVQKFPALRKSNAYIVAPSFIGLYGPAMTMLMFNNSKKLDLTIKGLVLLSPKMDAQLGGRSIALSYVRQGLVKEDFYKTSLKPLINLCNGGITGGIPNTEIFCHGVHKFIRGWHDGTARISGINNKFPCGAGCAPDFNVVKRFLEQPVMLNFLKPKTDIKDLNLQSEWVKKHYYGSIGETSFQSQDIFAMLVSKFSGFIKIWDVSGDLDSYEPVERQMAYFQNIPEKDWKDKREFFSKGWTSVKKFGKYKKVGNVAMIRIKEGMHMEDYFNRQSMFNVIQKFLRESN